MAYEDVVLGEVEDENTVRLAELASLRVAVIASGWPDSDAEGKIGNINKSLEFFRMAGKGLLPYFKWDERDVKRSEVEELRKEYVKQFGDPSDPKFQAEMAKLQERLKQQADDNRRRAAAEVQKDEDRLKARLQQVKDRQKRGRRP